MRSSLVHVTRSKLSPLHEILTDTVCRLCMCANQYLHPNLEKSREAPIAQKQTQADCYNQEAEQFQDLKQYQNVRVQLDPNKPIWQKATVVQQPTDWSPKCKLVQTESGSRYFRNRGHLRLAIQSDQPDDLMGQPATPAELVAHKYCQLEIVHAVCTRPHPSQYCSL